MDSDVDAGFFLVVSFLLLVFGVAGLVTLNKEKDDGQSRAEQVEQALTTVAIFRNNANVSMNNNAYAV